MSAWVDYQIRSIRSALIERGKASYLDLSVYSAGELVAPTSGTISIYDGTNTAIVSAAAVTISGSKATYTVSAATTTGKTLGSDWRVEWALTMPDGYVHDHRQQASLVRVRLAPVATDADLLRRHPDLASYYPSGWTSWQDALDEAWAMIEGRLEAMGRRPYLVLSPEALRPIHLATTLEIICRGLSGAGDPQNKWLVLADHYRDENEAAWSRTSLVYDQDDDGQEAARRRRAVSTSVWLTGRA